MSSIRTQRVCRHKKDHQQYCYLLGRKMEANYVCNIYNGGSLCEKQLKPLLISACSCSALNCHISRGMTSDRGCKSIPPSFCISCIINEQIDAHTN